MRFFTSSFHFDIRRNLTGFFCVSLPRYLNLTEKFECSIEKSVSNFNCGRFFFWNFILLLSLSYFYWSQVFLITGNKPPFYSLSTEKIRSTRFLQIKLILTEEKIIKHKRNNSWFFFLFCFKWGKTEKKRERKKEELYGAIYGRSGPSWVPQWVLVHFWNIYLMVHIFLI